MVSLVMRQSTTYDIKVIVYTSALERTGTPKWPIGEECRKGGIASIRAEAPGFQLGTLESCRTFYQDLQGQYREEDFWLNPSHIV